MLYLEREGDGLVVPAFKRDLVRERGPVVAAVLAALKDGPRKRADIIRESGAQEPSVTVALRRLLLRGEIRRTKRATYALARGKR